MRDTQAHRQRQYAPALPHAATAITAITVLAGLVFVVTTLRNTLDPLERQARALELARAAQVEQNLTPYSQVAGAIWTLAAPIGALAVLFVALALAWRRWGSRPAPAHELVVVEQEPKPARRTAMRLAATPAPLPLAEPAQLTAPAPQAPPQAAPPALDQVVRTPHYATFGELLDQGLIGVTADGRRQPLILGLNPITGAPVFGTVPDLLSNTSGGQSGAGKSNLLRVEAGQIASNGGKLIVLDPHAGARESLAQICAPLAPALLCDVADTEQAMLRALKLADDELRRRIAAQEYNGTPWTVAIDEWTSLQEMESGKQMSQYIGHIVTQGRKYGVNVILSAHAWEKANSGSFRDHVGSSYILRMRRDTAGMMTGLTGPNLPGDTLQLETGWAYLVTRGRAQRVVVPRATPEDMAEIGRRLQATRPFTPTPASWITPAENCSQERPDAPSEPRRFGFRPAVSGPAEPRAELKPSLKPMEDETQPETQARNPENLASMPETLPPETQRILTVFAEKKRIGDVVKAIHGDISGPRYNQLRNQIEETIYNHWNAETMAQR